MRRLGYLFWGVVAFACEAADDESTPTSDAAVESTFQCDGEDTRCTETCAAEAGCGFSATAGARLTATCGPGPCTVDCAGEGTRCAVDCGDSEDCQVTCDGVAECTQGCSADDAVCTLECTMSESCAQRCTGGRSCVIACELNDTCDQPACEAAECALRD